MKLVFPVLFCLWCLPLAAEARLLTGDANGQPHAGDPALLDLSADGDLALFSAGPPAEATTPGITFDGLYVRRLSSGVLDFVSDPAVAHPGTVEASLSDDGRYVSWRSSNGHVYWRDVQTDETRLVTGGADGVSRAPILRGDGLVLAFASQATNLIGDSGKLPSTSGAWSVYLYNSVTGTTTIASLGHDGSALSSGVGAGTGWNEFDFTNDGSAVVFNSAAPNAHPDRPAGAPVDFGFIYRRDVVTGEMALLNRNAAGEVASGSFSVPRCDADAGRVVFFGEFVGVLTDFGGTMDDAQPSVFRKDVYAKEAAGGAVWRASRTTGHRTGLMAAGWRSAATGKPWRSARAGPPSWMKTPTRNLEPSSGRRSGRTASAGRTRTRPATAFRMR